MDIVSGKTYRIVNAKATVSCIDVSGDNNDRSKDSTSPPLSRINILLILGIVIGNVFHDGDSQRVLYSDIVSRKRSFSDFLT
jgi:hypothetical protein